MSSTNGSHIVQAGDAKYILLAVSVLFIILDLTFLALRFYAARLHKISVGVDGFVLLAGVFIHVGLCILGIAMIYLVFNVKEDAQIRAMMSKCLYALEWLYFTSGALPKIAVLLLYIRIFASRVERLLSHIVLWMVIANCLAYLIACSLQCRPLAYSWDRSIPGGKCLDIPLLYKLSSTGNIITDVAIFILPWNVIIGLRASTARRIGLLFIFSIGSVGTVASIIRIVVFMQGVQAKGVWNLRASVKLVSWSIVEPGLYIIAACSLKLRPVIREMDSKFHLKKLYGWIPGKFSRKTDSSKSPHLSSIIV